MPRRLSVYMYLWFYSCSYLSVERVSVHHDGGEVLGPGQLGDPLLQVSYTHLQERPSLPLLPE